MKKVIALVMVLTLVLMVGCAKETVPAKPAVKQPTGPGAMEPTTPDTSSGMEVSTETEVADLEANLDDLESIDSDIDSDLDSLDEDLNFEI